MPFGWRWPWAKRPPLATLERLQIVVYTRIGCHLCTAAWERLRHEHERYRFELMEVDVDTDPDLTARFGDSVPVVTVDGKVRFRGVVNPVLLARLLAAEAARRCERNA
jgi:glutaredoxin